MYTTIIIIKPKKNHPQTGKINNDRLNPKIILRSSTDRKIERIELNLLDELTSYTTPIVITDVKEYKKYIDDPWTKPNGNTIITGYDEALIVKIDDDIYIKPKESLDLIHFTDDYYSILEDLKEK